MKVWVATANIVQGNEFICQFIGAGDTEAAARASLQAQIQESAELHSENKEDVQAFIDDHVDDTFIPQEVEVVQEYKNNAEKDQT